MSDEIKPSENVRVCVCVCVCLYAQHVSKYFWNSLHTLCGLRHLHCWQPSGPGSLIPGVLPGTSISSGLPYGGGLPCKSPLLGSWVLLRETRGDPARLAQPPQEPAPGTQVWGPTCKPFPAAISGQDSGHQANYTPRGSCKEKDTISILPMT